MPADAPRTEPLLSPSDLTVAAAALLAGIAVLDILIGGALAGLLLGHGWAWPSTTTIPSTLGHLATHPGSPAAAYAERTRPLLPGPHPYWGTIAALVAVETVAGALLGARSLGRRAPAGLATRAELRRATAAPDRGAPIGTYLGRPVHLRGEDSAIVIAPARAGKTTRLAVGRIADAPGAVLATSTKADLVVLTAGDPHLTGAAHVFDPDRMLDWPRPCRWDAVAGCDDVREALTRARAMVAARPLRGERNSGFFEGASETVLRCLLHAAALAGLSMREVLAWSRDFTDDQPYEILRTHPSAATGWLDDLRTFCRSTAPETISSTAMSLGLVLKSMADPAVLDLVCPRPGQGLDVDDFVAAGADRLYLLSEGGDGVNTAPLITAFAAAVVTAARRHSQTRPDGHLDPPLTLVLDEAANVAPLPNLPTLMADGGGRGITTWTFVQSFSQLRTRWGRDGADTIWGASSAKLILGGCTEADDLERISRVIGDRWAARRSHTSRGGLLAHAADHSTSTSRERERVLPVPDLRRLPVGEALLLYRACPAALIHLPAWWERKDARRFHAPSATSGAPMSTGAI